MWILTQEKDKLVFVRQFRISKNLGGKTKKYAIVGYTANPTLDGAVECAFFPTETAAHEELGRLITFMEEFPGKVYAF